MIYWLIPTDLLIYIFDDDDDDGDDGDDDDDDRFIFNLQIGKLM